MTAITFQEELFSSCIREARPFLELHWQELARNKDRIRLAPAFDAYLTAEAKGQLCIVVARHGANIVGYACYAVERNLHYSEHVWAVSDIFWVHPEWRGKKIGEALFRFVEARLQLRGASVMHTTCKIAHPAAGLVLGRLGHEAIEIGYSKTILD